MTSSLVAVSFEPDYGHRTLQVGGRETILKITVPTGMVGFIKAVATNWPSEDPSTWQEWYIDNQAQPPKQIFTPIGEDWTLFPRGSLPRARKYDPPIIAKYVIEFLGQNNGDRAYVFEALCRGSFYEKPSHNS